MENKEKKKTGAVIGTVVAALLCGCPGLAGICWGGLSAIVSFMPNADINIGGSSDPDTAFMWGIGALCGGLIFIVIPIVVGILTLRKKRPAEPKPEGEPPVSNEPLPPTS